MAFWEPLGSFPGLQGGLCGPLGVFGGLGEASFRLRLIFAFDIIFGVVLIFCFPLGWILAQICCIISSRGFSLGSSLLGLLVAFQAPFGDSGFRFEASCNTSCGVSVWKKATPKKTAKNEALHGVGVAFCGSRF